MMPERIKQTRKTYATRKFVGDKVDELARIVEKAFRKVATKEDVNQFLTKEDAAKFITKDYFDKKLRQFGKQLLHDFGAKLENREAELQGAHEDELAAVEGKKEAPAQWKTMPRRLATVEQEVDKVKDHLKIS